MKGKIGLVVGLGVGYVLGTRAGRERYEQIKTQWLKVWHLDPVQEQVERAKGYVGEKAAAVPGVLWGAATKVVKAATSSGTPGERLDSTLSSGKKAADDVAEAVEDAAEEVQERAAKPAAKKQPAKKPSQNGK